MARRLPRLDTLWHPNLVCCTQRYTRLCSEVRMGRRGADIIVDDLVEQRVPYLVGLCGHGILGLLDAAYERRGDITTISTHDERVAGFIADAYYRVSGRPIATY